MREIKDSSSGNGGGGAVVAAVVAILEKQSISSKRRQEGTRKCSPINTTAATTTTTTKTKFRSTSTSSSYSVDVDENFQSAVKDFNSVAEDVEKTRFNHYQQNCAKTERKKGKSLFNNANNYLNYHQDDDEVKRLKASSATNNINNITTTGSTSDELYISSSSDGTSSSSDSSTSDSEREHVIAEGLATIAEEERPSSSQYQGLDEEDSTPEDDSTIKDKAIWPECASNDNDSTSDVSTTSSERPPSLRDSSTRCNNDFQWLHKETMANEENPPLTKPPISRSLKSTGIQKQREKSAPGSLDRRRHHQQQNHRQERDQKSRSSHVLKSPPRLDDFTPCQGWCCNSHDVFENFHRRHERTDPQRYGSSPMLMEQRYCGSDRGSHSDIYGDCNRFRHDSGCCSYHMMPPPCCFYGDRGGYHWPPYYSKPGDQDEKFRKLQYEKDNLQLQVQVLTEQIEAQSDKITDLEKMLGDRKQMLSDAEEKLQREVLSRSSLETQKLELMSIMSELKLQQAALERENLELRSHYNNNGEIKKPPLMPRMSSSPSQLTSTPVHHSNQTLNLRMSPSPSPVILAANTTRRLENSSLQEIQPPKTPPSNYRRQIDIHYGSLPRQQFLSNGGTMDSNANPAGAASGAGAAIASNGGTKKGVVFADADKILDDETSQSSTIQLNNKNNKGIKKILGRMRRSGSGNLEELPGISEFQRGGVRATAAARLGWSEPHLTSKPDKPFAEWDIENICDWLQDLGLDQYIPDSKRWLKNGQQLQETPIQEIEKELNIKNPLHRKKLQLALIDTQENGSSDPYLSQAGQLDTAWVLRWLDDIGLPQHKESFLINRVDGRVLHRLTIDDLALLHVTSLLHVASIKRGIHVLRENAYDPGCLQRRSLPDDPPQHTPKQVSQWTTHRVMEWLRAVDLAEYAPNLRGAGVHGGLMVYETKFTAELLASLLSIPPGKTLLRRHLNTHFKELLGKDIIQVKREAEATMGYIPLTPSAKLKVAKKSQFSLKRKKSKGEADYGDLVCPLNPEKQSGELNGSALNMGMMRMQSLGVEDVSPHLGEQKVVRSLPASIANSPIPQRHV